jgi:uncharacterized protein (DUF58 family)
MNPTLRVVGILVLLAVIAAVASPLVALIGCVLLGGALIADSVSLRHPVEFDINFPERLVRGTPAELVVTPRSASTRAAQSAQVRQAIPSEVEVNPSLGRGSLRCLITAKRRGELQLPPAAVRVDGRWRLLQRTSLLGSGRSIAVLADLPAAVRLAESTRRSSFGIAGVRRGALGLGTEFESVREYVSNDDIRRVNWPTSARTGHPMTNQFRQDQDRQVLCVVDCGRMMGAPIAEKTRLDAAVDAALALALVSDTVGDRCGLLAFDSVIRQDIAPRRAGMRKFLEVVSDLEVAYEESRFDLAFATLAHRQRSLLVLFTDLFDQANGALLVDALPILTGRHAVLIASCLDPDVIEATQRSLAVPRDAYAAAIGLSMMEDQRALRATLRRNGAEVVSTLPEQFSAACVQAYLRLKSRNRL